MALTPNTAAVIAGNAIMVATAAGQHSTNTTTPAVDFIAET
ncbi:MAG: hypothetical protein WC378_04455 [Opitutaceae bacterium]|jgi:hypothetical protein